MRDLVKTLLRQVPEGRSLIWNRWVREAQPRAPDFSVVFTALTRDGLAANGKVSAFEYLPPFCDHLRRAGVATTFVSSLRELKRALRQSSETVLVHIYGEDHEQIVSDRLTALDARAALVFNPSRLGPLLADKQASQDAFAGGGIPVPPVIGADGPGFVRARMGTHEPTIAGALAAGTATEDYIKTAFVDTRVPFRERSYYTTVRLHCLDDEILHAYPRARDAAEGDPSVHAADTPRDPDLIEHLHQMLVVPNGDRFRDIARAMFGVLGHGFFAHDLLIDATSGDIFVCESGLKFDDPAFWMHLEPVAGDIPSQARLYPVDDFARYVAGRFLERCRHLLEPGGAPS